MSPPKMARATPRRSVLVKIVNQTDIAEALMDNGVTPRGPIEEIRKLANKELQRPRKQQRLVIF